jgi:hypothetical protein
VGDRVIAAVAVIADIARHRKATPESHRRERRDRGGIGCWKPSTGIYRNGRQGRNGMTSFIEAIFAKGTVFSYRSKEALQSTG